MTGPVTQHVAHFNWGVLKGSWGTRAVAEFEAGLDRVNGLAAQSPGFVWRLGDDEMDAEQQSLHEIGQVSRVASTLSVWQTVEDLESFAYNGLHGEFFGRRAEWFRPQEKPRYVLWDIPAGRLPTVAEGMDRRAVLRRDGPTDAAYDFSFARARRAAA